MPTFGLSRLFCPPALEACSILAISVKHISTLIFSFALTLLILELPRKRYECPLVWLSKANRARSLAWRLIYCRWQRSWHLSCCCSALTAASIPWGSEWANPYLEADIVGDIITEQDGICTVVVCTDYRSERLLTLLNNPNTRSVPHLQLDFFIAQLHPPELEVYSDCRKELIVELVVYELAEKRGFAYVGEVVPTEESPTRTNLYSAATTGIIIEL